MNADREPDELDAAIAELGCSDEVAAKLRELFDAKEKRELASLARLRRRVKKLEGKVRKLPKRT